jgi:hypothetical protein
MCTFIRRLRVTSAFVQSLQNWRTIEFYLGAVAELNLERGYKNGYLLIDHLGRVEFIEDFLIFLPVAMHHLRTYRTLANFAIRFLLLSSFEAVVPDLIHAGLPEYINWAALEFAKDAQSWAGAILQNIELAISKAR